MMKTPNWWKKLRHDNEAGSSSGGRRRAQGSPPPPPHVVSGRNLPPPPRPQDFVGAARSSSLRISGERDYLYVRVAECRCHWLNGEGIDHPDVSLPSG
jgi:hypothetical protein